MLLGGRLEKFKIKCIRTQAKVVGTAATVAGAMVMTLMKGPILHLFWTKGTSGHQGQAGGISLSHSIKGSLMITVGCVSWACFMVLQVALASSGSLYFTEFWSHLLIKLGKKWSGFWLFVYPWLTKAITLKTYPAELSLTAWICLLGTLEGTAVALVMEKGNPSVWTLKWDTKLMAAVYSVRM